MQDGGWAALGVGGPNVRRGPDGSYEMRVCAWQADYPSRGGRLVSADGVRWSISRASMELDLGVVGGPEDGMIYRQFAVTHQGTDYLYYNAKNNRPGWNETIDLAIRRTGLPIVDPAKWAMTQGWTTPNGASFTVGGNQATSLGNGTPDWPQTLQGNVLIRSLNYAVTADVAPLSPAVEDRDSVLMARCTDRDTYYYAGVASWGQKYAIGVLVNGVNTQLAGIGSAEEIIANTSHQLSFVLSGSRLSLYDGGQLVLTVVDPTLIPDSSYVGLQCSTPTGRVAFGKVRVIAVPPPSILGATQ